MWNLRKFWIIYQRNINNDSLRSGLKSHFIFSVKRGRPIWFTSFYVLNLLYINSNMKKKIANIENLKSLNKDELIGIILSFCLEGNVDPFKPVWGTMEISNWLGCHFNTFTKKYRDEMLACGAIGYDYSKRMNQRRFCGIPWLMMKYIWLRNLKNNADPYMNPQLAIKKFGKKYPKKPGRGIYAKKKKNNRTESKVSQAD